MYKQVVSNEMLHMLGFKGDEIKCLYYMLNARGKLSSPFLSNLGYKH